MIDTPTIRNEGQNGLGVKVVPAGATGIVRRQIIVRGTPSRNRLRAAFGFPGYFAGVSLPLSARVFMFCSACVNRARLCSVSFARAASSGSIELSKNSV